MINSLPSRFYIKVFGCPMNIADAERLVAPLLNAGWTETSKPSRANLLIYVTCAVRQKSEDKVYGLGESLLALKKKNPKIKIVVTGCMATRHNRGNSQLNKKQSAIEKATRRRLSFADYVLSTADASQLFSRTVLEPHYSSRTTAYIPVSYGCDNFCSYCVVPYTRGPIENRPTDEILSEVRKAIKSNKKEIYLLGQNVNSWVGEYKNKKIDFPTLLSIVDKIDGNYWIRFISSHPKDISKELIDTIAIGNHITPYLHFALQSGSNSVLKRMNRHYTYQKFKSYVDYARNKLPGIAITTDIIVGFPGETNDEFGSTVKAFKECRFDMAYISMYSPRPGTVSAETMQDNVTITEKKRRWQILTDLLAKHSLENNKKLIGKIVTVLTERHIKRNNQASTLARTATNKEVEIRERHPLGRFINTKIKQANSWSLQGV